MNIKNTDEMLPFAKAKGKNLEPEVTLSLKGVCLGRVCLLRIRLDV